VLSHIEGHFIEGYGDAEDRPDKPIELKAGSWTRAEQFLASHAETLDRFQRVGDLIQGFETPFGMELVTTVHWVATREKAVTVDEALGRTYSWNDRKRRFTRSHVLTAWNVLQEQGWLPADHY
jgi:hypothetical protein